MWHFGKLVAAGTYLLLSLAGRALCSTQYLEHTKQPATSYSYFSMSHHGAPPPLPLHHSHPAPIQEHLLDDQGDDGDDYEHVVLAHPKYEFKYGVEDPHTGDYKDAKEERDGDVVKGEYSLLQPDGRKRIVHYTASKHGGFNAIVSYSGHAIHPEDLLQQHGHQP